MRSGQVGETEEPDETDELRHDANEPGEVESGRGRYTVIILIP